ncbi:uroporphyrinogen-III C-methyltransferase [Azohydromonas caseinilytica]|uniref:uroporphyrinogen-III C-methyltransferase n=1 Tax=Azohydromonas caseinilytica TaxID=2728836 RepID=A0A848F794_9BURK|nr:uroporphyrinogen-III C-methyltransferase [Azohydromonas caseinilytica]NML15232.1 uroporphyrinogen-III C-methyltransferase [Azohydromonas caseinilytica]
MSVLDEPLHFSPAPAALAPRAARVTLVGAGPGDPDLLTVRAERALRGASLVLYDHLVSREVLRLVPTGADLIYVGKESAHHTLPQEDICALMVRLARSGRALVRLKGGDPYIFGRGGEEVQALAAAGVPFEVVPGISAAQAAAAESGMPLTHRDHAASVVLATGHRRADNTDILDMDWAALARPRQTVVIYMGVGTLPTVCAQLMLHGLAADTPAALVERASQPGSRRVVGTLQTLPVLARLHEVRPPALLIVGGVVALHAQLAPRGQAVFS